MLAHIKELQLHVQGMFVNKAHSVRNEAMKQVQAARHSLEVQLQEKEQMLRELETEKKNNARQVRRRLKLSIIPGRLQYENVIAVVLTDHIVGLASR